MDVVSAVKLIEEDLLEDAIEELNPKDLISVYISLKEFLQPKLQRTNAAPVGDIDREFKIIYVNGYTDDESLSKDPQKEREDHLLERRDAV